MQTVPWSDFQKILIVAGTITRVEAFPEARKPAFKVWVNFGSYGERKTSAQITRLYTVDELIGRQVIGILNFEEKQIGPFRSQFLLSGFETENGVVLSAPERRVPDGTRLS
ncbi:tRNA-binding protein [Acetobacter thailandicus]|uniref:tRNA-binding protein n=1 Tax=Acetobacter thailandicus TaxID=1502842 RepID=A0ABT3QH46_9PROT|nr:tRNA-binding protein [Acetobacter thailandicus]MCX2564607.1 tRNA-binding protein [Acetobacter thailandicus]NHN95927.1 tRNA-binding protein [Acetobacter thailandicus]